MKRWMDTSALKLLPLLIGIPCNHVEEENKQMEMLLTYNQIKLLRSHTNFVRRNGNIHCVIFTICHCIIVWNKRCSSRTSASLNRSDAAIQPGMQLRFILSAFLILPVCLLLYRPLWCSTDRCGVLTLPLCRPEVLGECTVILSCSFKKKNKH